MFPNCYLSKIASEKIKMLEKRNRVLNIMNRSKLGCLVNAFSHAA
jgi:hypothetical protein